MYVHELTKNSIMLGWLSTRHTWVLHVSLGRPAWWKPDFGKKHYRGVTEWRTGWLLMAVQIARRPR